MTGHPTDSMMELVAQFMLTSMRQQMSATPQELRAWTIELMVNAVARVAVEYLPAADAAKLLRQYADSIEGG